MASKLLHGDSSPLQMGQALRESLPCSVLLPAGTGKTQLLVDTALSSSQTQQSVLILTHTHAGVEAIKNRLRKQHVSLDRMTVQTIDSWCVQLIRFYPSITGVRFETPDWSQSASYHSATTTLLSNPHIASSIQQSYTFALVDEYQDCLREQHDLIVALNKIVKVGVFGDPLQSSITWGSNRQRLVDWSDEVESVFNPIGVDSYPWRWHESNPELGAWLLDIRERLSLGFSIDLRNSPVNWIEANPKNPSSALYKAINALGLGSIAILGKYRPDCARAASLLRGEFSLMEEMQGKYMLNYAQLFDHGSAATIAASTLQLAKDCANGIAGVFPSNKVHRLAEGKPILARDATSKQSHQMLSLLLTEPTASIARSALLSIQNLSTFTLYCHEAWHCILNALEELESNPTGSLQDVVNKQRNEFRVAGRYTSQSVVSRPLLVKGLEFDHSILLSGSNYNAASLYVALTRGSKSVSVISPESTLNPSTY